MNDSIVFDQAADYYDRTRALPPDQQTMVTDLLARELSGRGRCLEPGVGTGRMALPLRERGVSIVGIDLSLPMMERLVQNAGGAKPFPLLRCDTTALPFSPASFGAAFLCHVLHLVPRWRDAAAELVRVVAPGGVVLVDLGGSATRLGRELHGEFARQSGQARPRPGVTDPRELDDVLAGLGAPLRAVHSLPFTITYTVNQALARFDTNQFSSTWRLEEATRRRAAAATRAWAERRWPDLDKAVTEDAAIVWRAYDVSR